MAVARTEPIITGPLYRGSGFIVGILAPAPTITIAEDIESLVAIANGLRGMIKRLERQRETPAEGRALGDDGYAAE